VFAQIPCVVAAPLRIHFQNIGRTNDAKKLNTTKSKYLHHQASTNLPVVDFHLLFDKETTGFLCGHTPIKQEVVG